MADQNTGVYVTFGADTSGLTKAVKSAKSEVKALGDELKTGAANVAKWGTAVAAAAAAGFGAMILRQTEVIGAQDDLAKSLQTTVTGLANVQRAAELSGVPLGALEASSRALAQRLSLAATGAGPAADAIARLGFTAQQLQAMPLDERIGKINDALHENIPAAEQAAIATDLFGRSNALAMAKLNPEAIAEGARQARLFGHALSDIDSAKVEMAGDAFSTFGYAAEGISKQLAVQFAPLLKALGDEFLNAAQQAGGFGTVAQRVFNATVNSAAFVIDAIDGIKRAFEIVADALIVFNTKVGGTMLKIFTAPIRGFYALAEALPGEMGKRAKELGDKMSENLGNLDAVGEQAGQNIADNLMKPLAGDEFRERVKQALEDANNAAAQSFTPANTGGGGGGTTVTESQKKAAEEAAKAAEEKQKRIADNLASLQQSLLTENEIIAADYEEKRMMAREAFEAGLMDELEYGATELSIEADKQAKLTDIAEREKEARVRLAKTEAQLRQQGLSKMMNDLSTLMNSKSRKLFEIGKVAAIASAIMDGKSSAISSFKAGAKIGGPILGAAFAAASIAKTSVMIQSIRSQQFGGGGSGSSVGSGGSSNTQNVNADTTPINSGASGNPLEVKFTGISADRSYSGKEISTLFDRLREEAGDRGVRFLPLAS